METDDPRVALGAKDVRTRAAAARDLASVGTLDDLERLVQLALTEKSSAIRLYAAAAAADIVSRGGAAVSGYRSNIEDWLRRADPATNPSLLMLWSPFPERAVILRLLRMMRDPRNAVRAGASVAFRRMALSAGAMEAQIIEALAADAMKKKLTPDAALEMARLAGELGWSHSDDVLRNLGAQSAQVREAVEEALERNRLRGGLETFAGFWVSTGLDVPEKGDPVDGDWLAIVGSDVQGPEGSLGVLEPGEDGRFVIGDEPARLLWTAPPGDFYERRKVIQTATRAWWCQRAQDFGDLVERRAAELPPAAYGAIRPELEALEGAAGVRARLIAAWGAKDLEQAKASIDQLTGKKKPRNDLWFWRGRIYADLGDPDTAKTALEIFLAKAKKNGPYRAQAESLLAQL